MVLSIRRTDSRTAPRPSATTGERLALWYVPVPNIGGVARHTLDAVRAGVPGWRIVVLCPPGALADELRARGAAVVTGPVSPADGARTAVAGVRRMLEHLRPDVLHTHLAFADIVGIAAATGVRAGHGGRVRVVSTEHGIAGVRGYYQKSRVQARAKSSAHRARLMRTDAVIAVSESTREQILGQWWQGARVQVVRNGVDAPTDPVAPDAGLRVLSLSRLAPEKRIDQLLRAFALVAAKRSDAALTVAGTGPEEDSLREVASQLGLGERVRFVGHVDAAHALREHDVVAQFSDWENLSYTLLDAVAAGLGVVATDVGGNREIVPARCLVDAADHRTAAETIIAQGQNLEERPRPEESGAAWTVADMTASIADVYAGVLR